MRTAFDIALSRFVSPADFIVVLNALLPAGKRIEIQPAPGEPSAPDLDVWATVESTKDPAWPCVFQCWECKPDCGLAPYPDLKIAAMLWKLLGVNALCDMYAFAGDEEDSSKLLACVNGEWHVADASDAPFLTGEATGVGIRLIRPLQLRPVQSAKPTPAPVASQAVSRR